MRKKIHVRVVPLEEAAGPVLGLADLIANKKAV